MADWERPLTKSEMDAIRGVLADPARHRRNEQRVRDGFWQRFRRIAGHIPFAVDVLAAFYCATDPNTSFRVRAILFAALVGFLWPSSFIPRLAFAVGILDEAAMLMIFVRTLGGAIKPEHYAHAREVLRRGL